MGLRFGTGQDGDVTISANMEIGAESNFKQYANLTVNNGVRLKMNADASAARILCSQRLNMSGSTSEIEILGRPNTGGVGQSGFSGNGGNGGNVLLIQCKHIIGSGKIFSQINHGGVLSSTSSRGCGGGGAGGIIIIVAYTLGEIIIEAKGGNGGERVTPYYNPITSSTEDDGIPAHIIGIVDPAPASSGSTTGHNPNQPGGVLDPNALISKLRLLINMGNAQPPETWSGGGGGGGPNTSNPPHGGGGGGSYVSSGGRGYNASRIGGGGGGSGGFILVISKFDPISINVDGGRGGVTPSLPSGDDGNQGSYFFMDIGNA